ncbi:hypothetical protein ACQE98_03610 [Ornithinimicrobium sp. W1679]|uniref:hypothetical protein n=1 Tax=unclassified Ornithinimicrobium TaxID=2615080 RepID=UPI003CF0996F
MAELLAHWADLRSAHPSHLRVRLVALLGAALFALSLALAGGGGPVAWAGILVLGALVVYQPTTLMPVVLIVFGVASWWAGVAGPWHWALLPAAWGLLLVHAASALAASVPSQAPLPSTVLRVYAVRTAVVGAVTVLVWGLAGLVVHGPQAEGLGVLPGIVGLAAVAGGLTVYLRRTARG